MTRRDWISLGVIVIALLLGGFIGWRMHPDVKVITKTEYIKGDSITGHVDLTKPEIKDSIIYKELPVDTVSLLTQILNAGLYEELFNDHYKSDTVYLASGDSSKIINDWRIAREYTQTLIDNDTVGNLNITSIVQFNRLRTLDYTFTPIQKIITKVIETKRVVPFVGIGGSSMPSIDIEAGLFLKNNYGISFQYQRDLDRKDNIYGGKLIKKF